MLGGLPCQLKVLVYDDHTFAALLVFAAGLFGHPEIQPLIRQPSERTQLFAEDRVEHHEVVRGLFAGRSKVVVRDYV